MSTYGEVIWVRGKNANDRKTWFQQILKEMRWTKAVNGRDILTDTSDTIYKSHIIVFPQSKGNKVSSFSSVYICLSSCWSLDSLSEQEWSWWSPREGGSGLVASISCCEEELS